MTATSIRFLRRGRVVELTDVRPMDTVLDYLRLEERACGTKEGCAEGDCGACTIALGTLKEGRIRYEAVNSCIQLMGHVDGKEIIAVDDIAEREGNLHPVQDAMVRYHGSQCGFCTPGFIMSLFTLYHSGHVPGRADVNDWLAGNLCRCTGYRPIVDAALSCCRGEAADTYAAAAPDTLAALKSLQRDEDVFIGDDKNFLSLPVSVDSLAELYAKHPDAVLVAGATDVGLWITKQLHELPKIIFLHRAGLDRIAESDEELTIGACATYADAEHALSILDPDLRELTRRLGSKQVRAAGTIGGNIANGSPIGDMPPALIALGATLDLRRGMARRSIPLEDYFIAYGKQDRTAGEFVTGIRIPKLKPSMAFRCYKISKRFDQDISALMGAFCFEMADGTIAGARIAFGGMAGIPKRAKRTETAVTGLRLDDEPALLAALPALAEDYQPIDDHRASAAYRMATARALLQKAIREVISNTTRHSRLVGFREIDIGRVA
jgi:xanthine dehydrogenase small subunit